jgi:desulfoferrodoxin (superoxide reductase-like protein)
MFPYDEHAKEYIGKWEIEPSKDEFARTMLAPGEVPQKSIFEHFISWIRS